MIDVEISVSVFDSGIATFSWQGAVGPDSLVRAISTAAEDALQNRGLRRLEISIPAEDLTVRRAVLRAGFRLEGVRREGFELPDGSYTDVYLFSRLASDEVSGSVGFSGVMNSALPKKRLIAHVLMRDAHDRVLLCETQFKKDWELPGGIVEPLEPPRLGAAREVREELGIDLKVGRLLVVDWMPPYLGWDDAIEMIFDGGMVDENDLAYLVAAAHRDQGRRIGGPGRAAELITPLAFRRLSLALGLGPDEMAYTEDGRTP